MSKYRSFGQLDTQFQVDGDAQFRGIDMKHDRALLEQGMVAKSINKRMRTGVATTRPGTRKPADFNPGYVNNIIGEGVYSNPNGNESLLVAETNHSYVWELRYGQTPRQVPITGGGAPLVSPGQSVWFVQAFDKVLLLRIGITPLVWGGLDYVGGFKPITKFDPADTSTVLIPSAGYGIPFQNRVLYVWHKDHLLMSDVLDYTSYDPVLADFRINAGEADEIVSIHPYSKESVLVFMKRSVHRLSNFTIDPTLAIQEVVTDELGAVGRTSAVQVGGDVIFLSRAGFYRVNQVFENQTVSAPVPISDLISPILEGINWDVIDFAGGISQVSLAMLGDYAHMAVPLGRFQPQNVLLYNTVTSQWESLDGWEDENVRLNKLLVTIYDGERRLFGFNHVFPAVYLLYEGITDQTGVTNPVNDILETRGYVAGAINWKRFERLSLALRTRNPSATVSALTDGYNEEKILTPVPITKSTIKFYPFAHKDFNPATDDPDEPLRQDYYQGETEWVAQDMSNLLPGVIDLLPGVDPEMLGGPKTESIERRPIRVMGRWCSIRIANTQGACDIIGCQVDIKQARSDVLTLA